MSIEDLGLFMREARAATMKLGKDEVTLRPTARAFLAVLEHEARVRAVPRQT